MNPSSSSGGSGNGSGSGGGANLPTVDLAACFGCGDAACPSERQACDDAPGCAEVLGCTVGCGNDNACKSQCTPPSNLTAEQITNMGAAMTSYTLCATLSCLSECSAKIDGIGGGPGSGGAGNSGGSGAESGGAGNSTGGKASGGAASGTGGRASGGSGNPSGGSPSVSGVMIFDGAGVGVGSEELGIDGGFYILEDSVENGELIADPSYHTDLDPVDDSVEPSTFEASAYPCVEGTVAQVLDPDGAICETNSEDCDWAAYWGGGIGVALKIEDDVAVAWDAETAGVTGFAFTLSGALGGVPLRFMVEDLGGNQFCVDGLSLSGLQTVEFSDLEHNCWDPGALALDPTQIKSISFQFVPDASQSYSVGLCVDNIYALD